jgi:hypothetical protein
MPIKELNGMSFPFNRFATVTLLSPVLRAISVFGTSSSKDFTRRLFTAEAATLLTPVIVTRKR